MECVGGGIDVDWLVLAAACCVRGLVSGGGGGGGGAGVALLVVGGAGVGVVLAGGLGVPVGRVGVACVRRVALAVLDWLWCRGVGGRRPHERPGGAAVRMYWVAAGGWCSLVWGVGGGAAGGGGVVWFGLGQGLCRTWPKVRPLCRHDWARRIAVVRSQGLPDC